MSNSTPSNPDSPDGIEVVELSDIDLDFAVEEVFREGSTATTLEATRTDPATADELNALELFRGLNKEDMAMALPHCQSIHAIPGYVLLASGRLNTKVFFVLEGQLRLYNQTGDKRPAALIDVGQSIALRSALTMQPAEHSVIATEVSHVIAVDVSKFGELAQRSHTFARNYTALLASYVRGDNCFTIGARTTGTRPTYIDELTLLHNQHWLNTMFPRLVARCRLGNKTLAVTAFAIDKLDAISKEHGIGAGLRTLEAIGHWVLDQTRPTDIVAIDKNRNIYAFLPESDLEAARLLAARLKALVQDVPITIAPEKEPITIGLRFGIAELKQGMKEQEFLAQAEALVQKSIKADEWLSEVL